MGKPTPVHRDMFNEFEAKAGRKTVNFRNESSKRDSVTSIEIHMDGDITKDIVIKPEDNVAMALSILGVGRVTDEVERNALIRAEKILDEDHSKTRESTLQIVIAELRAILIAEQRAKETSEKEMDEAYSLYRLAYPNAAVTRSEFPDQSMHAFWISTLRKMRKDPTVLGML